MTTLRQPARWILAGWLLATQFGCFAKHEIKFEEGDLEHYKAQATEIEYPDACAPHLPEATGTLPPLTLRRSGPIEYWDLTLEEAVRVALANSKVIRKLGGRVLQSSTGGVPTSTVYDPALQESNPNLGAEAALSAFDAQFATSMFWQRNDQPQNINAIPGVDAIFARILEQDLGNFQAELSKTGAAGTQMFLRNLTDYEWSNSPVRAFPSAYTMRTEAELRQPLMQGFGTCFNRIAGPNATIGNYNGVLIARVNNDIELAAFEAEVRNLVSDVENAYWNLYFTYRDLDAKVAGRDAALQTWRNTYALFKAGARGGEAENEAEAREQYFLFRGLVEDGLSGNSTSTPDGLDFQPGVYRAENNLRFLMGLTATDGRLIRPADEPVIAEVKFDWEAMLVESLTRRVELRQQRWRIKRREMELIASKNFLMPRLDGVALYRWRGFGDDLINPAGDPGRFDNAVQNLVDGDFQEWQLGVQLTVPIGFRRAMAGVRNAELNLARERAILEDQELQVTHDLSAAEREVARAWQLTRTNFNRSVAARRQVEAVRAAYEVGNITLDRLLDAQRRQADAESALFRSAVQYNVAIKQVHFVKGSLLEYNNVFLTEGPWPGKAYCDAWVRARRRVALERMDYCYQHPCPVSLGPHAQHQGEFAPQLAPGAATELEAEQIEPGSNGELPPIPEPLPPAEGAMTLETAQAPKQPASGKAANSQPTLIRSVSSRSTEAVKSKPVLQTTNARRAAAKSVPERLPNMETASAKAPALARHASASKTAPARAVQATPTMPQPASDPQIVVRSVSHTEHDAGVTDHEQHESNQKGDRDHWSSSGWKRPQR